MKNSNINYWLSMMCYTLVAMQLAPQITSTLDKDIHKPINEFHITIEVDGKAVELIGESEFMLTSSSYSIYMNEDKGRCAVHLLNFQSVPSPGIYDVEVRDEVRTGVVCVLNESETKERLASVSGTFTITSIDSDTILGRFEMILLGAITGKHYRIIGEVVSENIYPKQ